MEWKKAKTILIFLFIIIDIILLFVNISANVGKNSVQREQLLPILEKNNTIIDESIKLKNIPSSYVYEFTSIELNDEIKEALLGEYSKTKDGDFVSKDKNKILKVKNMNIYYENKNPQFEDFLSINEKNAERKTKKYLKILGINKYSVLSSVSSKDDIYTVNYVFNFEGNELFSTGLSFQVSKKGIHTIKGNVGIPIKDKGYTFELSGIETILLNFCCNNTFQNKEKIIDISLGCYLTEFENAATAQALPAYRIRTVNKTYIYDARDGVESTQRQLKKY